MAPRNPIPGRQDRKLVRCAIYTRKSSEDGLEQEFNSLHAQREACLNYIASQRHEGWRANSASYDDGGFSGGSLNRPALQQLLADVQAGHIDLIVIYKVDRLTRSLADFAKLVEIFDAHGASFVSITQHFNTSTSIGRLTLNMLLSFAQFEREVTGERIRDKIAASKRRGMWMGGPVPLGYDVHNHRLVVNDNEAEKVRMIFRSYLKLGSVRLLEQRLRECGVHSKIHCKPDGSTRGGMPFSRGALYLLLQNRLYRGEVAHKGAHYPGEHAAIVDEGLWNDVQAALAANRGQEKRSADPDAPSFLSGLMYDGSGDRVVASHAQKNRRRYRYYISSRLVTSTRADAPDGIRLPASDVEQAIIQRIADFLGNEHALLTEFEKAKLDLRRANEVVVRARMISDELPRYSRAALTTFLEKVVARVVLSEGQIAVTLDTAKLYCELLGAHAGSSSEQVSVVVQLSIAISRSRSGRETRLVMNHEAARKPDPGLVRLLVRAEEFKQALLQGGEADLTTTAREAGVSRSYVTRVARLGFLAPDIVAAILDGRQPPQLTVTRLTRLARLPLAWDEQRRLLGFG